MVTVIALVVPSYAVSGTQTSSGQPQTVYTLPSPQNLTGRCGDDCWDSQVFSLQPGTIQVTVTECEYCEVFIANTNASFNADTALIGPVSPFWQGVVSNQVNGTARVVDAGNFQVVLGNDGDSLGNVSSVVVVNTPTSPVPEFSSPTAILIIAVFAFLVVSYTRRENKPRRKRCD